jgi:hypothetical protein
LGKVNWDFLQFLGWPPFVICWYGFGGVAAVWVFYDMSTANRHVMPALKAGWPIILIFFSVIGLLLYLLSCRPTNISKKQGIEAKQIHSMFVSERWKKVVGSDIHCIAGDGLGIISAMIVTRWLRVPFWTEFWIEYAVGFAFGWFIFQYWSMRKMGNGPRLALRKGGRAEFFSMITVMLGMGLVMRYVTPAVIGERPLPDTAAFWGFAALGLFIGAALTYPMNWWLVSIGWKHGMG